MTITEPPATASSEDLCRLALDYNWDDGMEFPHAIADHPHCDLAVALQLFWLANADEVYLGEASVSQHQKEWRMFSQLIADRIVSGRYLPGAASFTLPLTKVQIYNLRKKGLPDVFLQSISVARV